MARFQRSDDRRVIYLFITGFLYNDLHILERTINVKQFVTEMVQPDPILSLHINAERHSS